MDKQELKKLIDVAAGRIPADLVIKNCRVVDVYNCEVIEGDIAISDGMIAGVGTYSGKIEEDAGGRYAAPGFIDSHIHIESSCVTPEEEGRLLVPRGTTTIIADPHEIVNVKGLTGLDYMISAAERTALDVKFMLPSCVPATPFEHSGAIIDAKAMEEPIKRENILGLGEFMDFPGVVNASDPVLDKLLVARNAGKMIDGHSPGLSGKDLNAYAAAGVRDDHECSTVEEAKERLSRGMYVLMREGSACHNLRTLLKAVTPANSRRCLLCSDDRQLKTIFEEGHIDNHLRICAEEGIDPFTAIQMASLNAAECFGLKDRGAIAPGLRADFVLLDDLKDFYVREVYIAGQKSAENGKYLPETERVSIDTVRSSVRVGDFSEEKLKLRLKSGHVNVIDIQPGGVVTGKGVADVRITEDGDFVYDPAQDIVKLAVIERHNYTGNASAALLRGYGIKKGAVALTIAHDSHNIIAAGADDADIMTAVQALIRQEGGVVLVNEGEVIDRMPLVVGGLMSDQPGEVVIDQLSHLHKTAFEELGVNRDIDPIMTLCFMALPVIPELKLTDMGLFDVTKFEFIPIEA